MQAARARMRLEVAMRNRTAWNTAALVGSAMAGKLPRYDEVFPPAAAPAAIQTPEQQEVALRMLAAAWGAQPADG